MNDNRTFMPRSFTPDTLAAHWGCSAQHIKGLIGEGHIRAFRIGKNLVRVTAEEAARLDKSPNIVWGGYLKMGVYVLRYDNVAKIGKTSDLKKRLHNLQLACPVKLEVVAEIPTDNGHALEKKLHARFAKYRSHGEWFRIEGTLRRWIDGGCKV